MKTYINRQPTRDTGNAGADHVNAQLIELTEFLTHLQQSLDGADQVELSEAIELMGITLTESSFLEKCDQCNEWNLKHEMANSFYCERCQKLLNNTKVKCDSIKCFLCDDLQGLMKCVDKENNKWAHVICVNWNPDISFAD